MRRTVLLIEDDAETARLLTKALSGHDQRLQLAAVGSGRAGLQYLAKNPVDCALLDYHLPDIDGLQCLCKIRRQHPQVRVVMVTGTGSEEVAVEAMKLGAADYIVKHGRYLGVVPGIVQDVLARPGLSPATPVDRGESRRCSNLLREYAALGIIGESPPMVRVIELAERAAQSQVPVLLIGETGSGKELFARAIHQRSRRAAGSFCAQNCAALNDALVESELFGHVRGAFTGAERDRRGLFEQASGGTLFLDEVSELSPSIQAKLLRAVQDNSVRPLGANGVRQTDVRIIAASNRDLQPAIQENRFRLDLYYRLSVFPIHLPPLYERRGDISLLAEYLLRELSAKEGIPCPELDPAAQRILDQYSWPGNVRQLQNELHRLILCTEPGRPITASRLAPWLTEKSRARTDSSRTLKEIVRTVELATIEARLRDHRNHRSTTARSLGMTREALWAKIRQLRSTVPRP